MSHLYHSCDLATSYRDRQLDIHQSQWNEYIASSATLYIGNLGFDTTEAVLWGTFGGVASVESIHMGKNRLSGDYAGFAFIICSSRDDAHVAKQVLNGQIVDGRTIRVDWDLPILNSNRIFARGASGNQWRDDLRVHEDSRRGKSGGLWKRCETDKTIGYYTGPLKRKRKRIFSTTDVSGLELSDSGENEIEQALQSDENEEEEE